MGRMADARKRARRGETAAGVPLAPRTEAPPEQPHPGEPVVVAEPEPPAPAAEATPTPEPGAPRPAGPVELPASGLAEDILRQLEGPAPQKPPATKAPALAAEPSEAPRPVDLPASGLAEEVLGRGEMAGSHSLSFFAAPARDQRAAAEATEHLATFFLDREEYGVDVRQVQEIRRLSEITTVPRAPGFIRGVINLRGKILPVLDLKRKLGLGEVEARRATRIVVVRVGERLLGLLVDGASQVLKVPVSRIEPPPEEVQEKGGDYIRGVAKLEDRLIIVVDLGRLLAHELRAAGAAAATDGVS
jgi:purine-binding chemotaxis protein CheW